MLLHNLSSLLAYLFCFICWIFIYINYLPKITYLIQVSKHSVGSSTMSGDSTFQSILDDGEPNEDDGSCATIDGSCVTIVED